MFQLSECSILPVAHLLTCRRRVCHRIHHHHHHQNRHGRLRKEAAAMQASGATNGPSQSQSDYSLKPGATISVQLGGVSRVDICHEMILFILMGNQ